MGEEERKRDGEDDEENMHSERMGGWIRGGGGVRGSGDGGGGSVKGVDWGSGGGVEGDIKEKPTDIWERLKGVGGCERERRYGYFNVWLSWVI